MWQWFWIEWLNEWLEWLCLKWAVEPWLNYYWLYCVFTVLAQANSKVHLDIAGSQFVLCQWKRQFLPRFLKYIAEKKKLLKGFLNIYSCCQKRNTENTGILKICILFFYYPPGWYVVITSCIEELSCSQTALCIAHFIHFSEWLDTAVGINNFIAILKNWLLQSIN
jgi:hypothetical protein